MTHPLRLATGSHDAGSGKGCAMNVISWESGDAVITDLPACADEMLAKVVQQINDSHCDHRDGDLLCPPCSIEVLALAHRTVGTGGPLTEERKQVWVRMAIHYALKALPLVPESRRTEDGPTLREQAEQVIRAASAWLRSPDPGRAHEAGRLANKVYTSYAEVGQAYTGLASARAAAWSVYYDSLNATATDASDAVIFSLLARHQHDPAARLAEAHRLIDLFAELTGHTEQQPDPLRTAVAVGAMQRVTA
jgi:hypothetical protein